MGQLSPGAVVTGAVVARGSCPRGRCRRTHFIASGNKRGLHIYFLCCLSVCLCVNNIFTVPPLQLVNNGWISNYKVSMEAY